MPSRARDPGLRRQGTSGFYRSRSVKGDSDDHKDHRDLRNATDPNQFEGIWTSQVVKLASKLPGLQRLGPSKVWPKEDGSPTLAYRMIDMYFADYDAASSAVSSAEAGELFPILADLGSAGVKFIFFDVDQIE
jgi:hypothetical protein